MSAKKIIGLVVSILLVGAFAFCLTWTIVNWDKVTQGISGANLYTETDLNEAYEDGYNTALTNEAEYEAAINGYRDTVTNLNDQIALYASQISGLTETNNMHLAAISGLQGSVAELNGLIADYKTTQTANQNTINGLSAQVVSLQSQVTNLLAQISQNTNTISMLNNQITQLQNEVMYYEALLSAYQSDTRVIATFTVNNSVYNVQVADAGSTVTVAAPSNTAYFEFLGWTIDGENVITLSNYTLTANTTFIAKVINKYDVKFFYDGVQFANQIVAHGNSVSAIAPPANTQYATFLGWSADGSTILDLANYPITYTTAFYGVIGYSYGVTFTVQGNIHATQIVYQNQFAAAPAVPTFADYAFLGWSVDGSNVVDITQYNITHTTNFIAVLQSKYVVTFKVDGADYDAQKVAPNGYAVTPPNPSISGATFVGWSVKGTAVVNSSATAITGDTTFNAVFTCTITFNSNGGSAVSPLTVYRGGYTGFVYKPAKTNYTFAGWTLDGSAIVDTAADFPVTSDMTFHAVWKIATGVLWQEDYAQQGIQAASLSVNLKNFVNIDYTKVTLNVRLLVAHEKLTAGYWIIQATQQYINNFDISVGQTVTISSYIKVTLTAQGVLVVEVIDNVNYRLGNVGLYKIEVTSSW